LSVGGGWAPPPDLPPPGLVVFLGFPGIKKKGGGGGRQL